MVWLWQGSKKTAKPGHASHVAEAEDSLEEVGSSHLDLLHHHEITTACSLLHP